MKDFREKTLSGVSWSIGSQAGRQIAVLAANVALARLLTPNDFGIIATAIIFSNFAFIIAEQGLTFALIQRDEVSEEHLSTIFWVNYAVGIALSAAFFASAPLVARAYREPVLIPVMRIIAAMFSIFPLGMIHKVVLTRELEFRTIAVVEIVSAWLGGAAAVLMAWLGAGVFSIALQFVLEFVVAAVALWTLCPWRPRLIFRWSVLKELSEYSTNLTMTSILNYWVRNIDNLLIGLYLGAFQLGLYSRAYAIMLFPMSRVTWVFTRVMIRSFAMIRNDQARIREVFLKMTRVVALVTIPMMLGVAACAKPFVACVFGPQWTGMVPTLRVLSVVGMVQSVISVISSLYLSHDKTKLAFRVSLVGQVLEVIGIVVGLHWGILGVATGYALACVVSEPIDCYYGVGIVGLTLGQFFANLRNIFLSAIAMAACVAGVDAALARLPALPHLAADVLTGVAVYWSLLHVFEVKGYGELRGLISERAGVLLGKTA